VEKGSYFRWHPVKFFTSKYMYKYGHHTCQNVPVVVDRADSMEKLHGSKIDKNDTCLAWFMVFNATFNNISVISWWSVLLVEETGGPGENHQPVISHWQTFSHNVVSSTPRLRWDSKSQF